MSTLFIIFRKICIISVFIGVLLDIVTDKTSNKAIKMAATLYIISQLLTPVDINRFEIYVEDKYMTPEIYDKQIIEMASEKIESEISNLLNSKNISYKTIEVHIIKQSSGTELQDITITGVENNAYDNVKQIVSAFISEDKIIIGE